MATLGLTAPEKEAVEAFRRDVVEPSMTKLVVIDFWAEWCGPCKALTPILEKVTAEYAPKGVVLAKIDTDKNQFIASQFQIRSIPTVYAMFHGQLVADLTSARTESQLKQMLDQLLRQLPVEAGDDAGPDVEPLVAMGEQVLGEGDAMRALSIFEQVAEIAPTQPQVLVGRIRALLALGDHDTAQAAIDVLPDEVAKLPAVDQVRATLALARDAQPVDDLAGLRAEVEARPDDHDARFRLVGALMAAGDRDGAADHLLRIVAADRGWNDDAARQQLLKLFEAVGLEDPWVSQQRRKLSAILFG